MKIKPFWIIAISVVFGIGAIARYKPRCEKDISGQWQGTLQNEQGLRNVLKIARSDNGTWTAKLFSIDQAPEPIPMSSVTLQGSLLRFTVDAVQGSYEGALATDESSIDGTWTQRERSVPLNFVRATEKTAWSTEWPQPNTTEFPVILGEVDNGSTIQTVVATEVSAATEMSPATEVSAEIAPEISEQSSAVATAPHPVPTPTPSEERDPEIDNLVRSYWDHLVAGTVDKNDLTPKLARYWTPDLLAQASERRTALGPLRSFTFFEKTLTHGATAHTYALAFESGSEYKWVVQISADRKIAGASSLR